MDDKCVSCGAYVPEGKMICYDCEQIARTPILKSKKVPIWRKIIALILGVVLCVSFTACSNQQTDKTEEVTKIDNAVVDIRTPGGSYYSTFSDVEINYYDGEISNIYVNNNAVLAFNVSDAYEGGVYIIQGKDFDQIKTDMDLAKEAIANGDLETAQKYIESALDMTEQYAVYDYCPT